MDSLAPVAGLDDLDHHLDALLAEDPNSTSQLNATLFDNVELQLTEANIPAVAPRLLPKIVAVLHRPAGAAEASATVLASLATKLLGPVGFGDALGLATEEGLVAALGADAAPATNVLAMTVLHKAAVPQGSSSARREGGADLFRLARMNALLTAFVVRWLAAPAVEVGEKGGRVLGDLLDVDCPLPPPARPASSSGGTLLNGIASTGVPPPPTLRTAAGPGCLWRRLFHETEPHPYTSLIQALCTGRHPAVAGDSRQQSIAQGRLLRLLPRLAALNLAEVATGNSRSSGGTGLLQFAALHMVDKSDVLMHLSLVDFFEALVSVLRVVAAANPSTLDYTIEVLRTLLREATSANGGDDLLLQQLQSLPDRTVPEEADALRDWLRQLLPTSGTRVAGWQ